MCNQLGKTDALVVISVCNDIIIKKLDMCMIHYLTIFTLPTESRKGIRKRRKATKTEKKLEFFKPCTRTTSYGEPGESVMSL